MIIYHNADTKKSKIFSVIKIKQLFIYGFIRKQIKLTSILLLIHLND